MSYVQRTRQRRTGVVTPVEPVDKVRHRTGDVFQEQLNVVYQTTYENLILQVMIMAKLETP